jgi:hypothetical protein
MQQIFTEKRSDIKMDKLYTSMHCEKVASVTNKKFVK